LHRCFPRRTCEESLLRGGRHLRPASRNSFKFRRVRIASMKEVMRGEQTQASYPSQVDLLKGSPPRKFVLETFPSPCISHLVAEDYPIYYPKVILHPSRSSLIYFFYLLFCPPRYKHRRPFLGFSSCTVMETELINPGHQLRCLIGNKQAYNAGTLHSNRDKVPLTISIVMLLDGCF